MKCSLTRKMMFREIIETEESYINDLHGTLNIFAEKLKPILTESDYSIIFDLFPSLIEIHSTLLHKLKVRWDSFDQSTPICDVILGWLSSLHIYKQFAKSSLTASALMSKLYNENPDFFSVVKNCSHNNVYRGIEGLRSLRTGIPMQRIMRYRLMLESLRTYTPCTHQDYNDIVEAVQTTDSILRKIEHVQEQMEGYVRKKMILSKLFLEKPVHCSSGLPLEAHSFEQNKTKAPVRCEECSMIINPLQSFMRCNVCKVCAHEHCDQLIFPNCSKRSRRNEREFRIGKYMCEFTASWSLNISDSDSSASESNTSIDVLLVVFEYCIFILQPIFQGKEKKKKERSLLFSS